MRDTIHTRTYRRLLRLYPAAVQADFADEMTAVFAETVEHAKKGGPVALVATWLRELRSLPAALLQSHGSRRDFEPLTLAAAAVAILVASSFASRLVANVGLFFTLSWLLLGVTLIASGMLFGAGLRRAAVVTLVLSIALPYSVDRLLLRTLDLNEKQAISAPGVKADASLVATESEATTFLARMAESKTPRLRTSAHFRHGRVEVTSVRAGGVDGAYAALAILMLIGSTAVGRRLATSN